MAATSPIERMPNGLYVIGPINCSVSASTSASTPTPVAWAAALNNETIGTIGGGATFTHLPQPGSPAIDRALLAACPPIDQRGFIRPISGWQSTAAPLLDQGAAARDEEPRLLSGPNGAASLVFRRFDAASVD